MAVTVTHSTVVVVPDDGTSPVGSDEWNANHTVTGLATVAETGDYNDLINTPISGSGRDLLTEDRTYYIATDGDDSNDGLSALTPCETFEHVFVDIICATLDTAGFTVTIKYADGAYTEKALVSRAWLGGGTLAIEGNLTTPGDVSISINEDGAGAIDIRSSPAAIVIGGFKVENAGAFGFGLYNDLSNPVFVTGAMEYGDCGFAQILGAFWLFANYEISGDATYHWFGSSPAYYYADSWTVTLTGTPAFGAFITIFGGARLEYTNMTFIGSATGIRFVVEALGQIDTGEAGLTYLPGNQPGYCRSGGLYL